MSGISVASAVASLKRLATKATRDGMLRFGLPNDKAFGVAVGDIRALGKKFGRDHSLAAGLWKTDLYEPRMLACFVEVPGEVTTAQMDRWTKDFDNWGICDTACFHLFDRTPHAWGRIDAWADKSAEFVKRAAFALLASMTVHDKKATDEPFLRGLVHIERAATDERNFVKKAVNWALRSIGKRNATLHAAAMGVAERLSVNTDPAPRWVGKDALRELRGPIVARRLAK